MNLQQKHAFTLVELLVVVAIIAIIAALLLPSLAASMHEARMKQCQNTLRQFGASMIKFSSENDGAYPHRFFGSGTSGSTPYMAGIKPNHLKWKHSDRRFDWRIELAKALEINDLCQCPFTEWVDLAGSGRGYVEASYNFFTGFGFKGNAGCYRRGDIMEYNGKQFDILAGDMYNYSAVDNWLQTSHNTDTGSLTSSVSDDAGTDMLISRFTGPYNQDPIKLNYIRTDNSVFTVDYPDDPSLVVTPYATDGASTQPNWKILLPAKN